MTSREIWNNLYKDRTIAKSIPIFYFLRFKPGMSFLDVGCGSGFHLQYLRKKFYAECYGVDIVLHSGSEKKNYNFVIADASNLPFKDNVFDIVFSFGTIEHTTRTFECVRESFRVLKHGGQVAHTVPNLFSLHSLFARPLLKGLKMWRLGLERSFTRAQFHKLFQEAGFKSIKCCLIPFNTQVHSKQFSTFGKGLHLFKTLDNIIMKLMPFWGFFIAMYGIK